MTNYEYVIECNKMFAMASIDPIIEVGDGDTITYYINTNDLLYWGTADAEKITPDNLHILKEAYNDIEKVDRYSIPYTGELFACRVNNMRPQKAAYGPEDLWDLFDACGPERESDPGEKRHSVRVYDIREWQDREKHYRDALERIFGLSEDNNRVIGEIALEALNKYSAAIK